MSKKLEDNTLLESAQKGDREAFRKLVDENSRRLYSLAWRIVGNEQLAEDVVTFIEPITERINHYKKDTAALAKAAKLGAEKANESAQKTLKEVREIIGFKRFF